MQSKRSTKLSYDPIILDTFRLLHKLDAFGIQNESFATTVIKIPTGIPPHILVLMLVLGNAVELKASTRQRDGNY